MGIAVDEILCRHGGQTHRLAFFIAQAFYFATKFFHQDLLVFVGQTVDGDLEFGDLIRAIHQLLQADQEHHGGGVLDGTLGVEDANDFEVVRTDFEHIADLLALFFCETGTEQHTLCRPRR